MQARFGDVRPVPPSAQSTPPPTHTHTHTHTHIGLLSAAALLSQTHLPALDYNLLAGVLC
jgi:hypothetical protein